MDRSVAEDRLGHQELTNEQLLERYKQADPKAFTVFFERTHKMVFNYLVAKLGNAVDAEDALQEVFLRIHRAVLSYDPNQGALPWVFTIARNVGVDAIRKRGSHGNASPLIDDAVPDSAPSVQDAMEAKQELERLLASLSEEERQLIYERFLMGEAFESIAERQGVKPENARKKVSRLLQKVKASFAR